MSRAMMLPSHTRASPITVVHLSSHFLSDLTTRLFPTKNVRALLGLNLKFIHNPNKNVTWEEFEKKILPRFDRDLRVKVFMSGKEEDEPYNPKMYARSEWTPPNIVTPPPPPSYEYASPISKRL
jgi:hypothetical protein